MECLIQYLDDLEDTVYALALLGERLRSGLRTVLTVGGLLSLQGLGFLLALERPPLALALVSLLTVACLYRGSVSAARTVSPG